MHKERSPVLAGSNQIEPSTLAWNSRRLTLFLLALGSDGTTIRLCDMCLADMQLCQLVTSLTIRMTRLEDLLKSFSCVTAPILWRPRCAR